MKSRNTSSIPDFYTPADIKVDIEDDDASYWGQDNPGRHISAASVHMLLWALHEKEAVALEARRQHASIILQKHFRGWMVRKTVVWNPHHAIGKGFVRLGFTR
jgi:hypothetical protein